MPIVAWNVPFVSLIFLKRLLVFPILLFSLFLCIDHWGRLSYLSLIFFGTLYSNGYIFPFLLCLSLLFFSQLFIWPPQTTILPFCFCFLGMVLNTASCTISQPSVHNSSGTLLDLIPWIYLSLPLYDHNGFYLDHTWMILWFFPYFLHFKSEFGNKKFMIWASVSSWSCFCWLYRASPSLAANNIIWFQYWPSGDVHV